MNPIEEIINRVRAAVAAHTVCIDKYSHSISHFGEPLTDDQIQQKFLNDKGAADRMFTDDCEGAPEALRKLRAAHERRLIDRQSDILEANLRRIDRLHDLANQWFCLLAELDETLMDTRKSRDESLRVPAMDGMRPRD